MKWILLFILFGLVQYLAIGQSAKEILNQMDSAITSVNHLQCDFYKKERIENEYEISLSLLKVQKSPFKVYLKSDTPREGLEVLFRDGINDNDVLICTNTFPFFNLNFDPLGSTLRNKQHHTVYDLGFTTMQSLFHQFKANNPHYDSYLKLHDDTLFEHQECYKVEIDYIDFTWNDYTVKKGEDFCSIAVQFGVNDYMIMERNGFDDYDDIDEGDVIQVPNNYARSTFLYISKKTLLPIKQVVYDDLGLYEFYEYRNLVVNPSFEHNELDDTYSAYGF